jgi:phosphonate transport system substrate-binding protein
MKNVHHHTAIALCLLLPALAGCSKQEAAPLSGEARERTMQIGLLPEQNLFRQIERYEPLADYLSKKTGVSVKLKILPRYGNIIDNFVSENLDGAFFGSFTYPLAHAKLGVKVIGRPVDLNGMSTYYGLIFVRRDSGITSVRQMKGKRFVFVDKATTAGYLLPLAYFKKHGLDFRTYLRETYFSGTHEDAIYDVVNRRADIGAAKNTVYERLAASNAGIRNDLVVLERSPEVPENGLALKKDVDDDVKKAFAEALLNMHNDPEGRAVLRAFGARRFIETTDADYDPVYKYAREAGLDLATYDYMNE